eukprot:1831152-Pleurochrysis_carterae.AAC.2
MLWLARCGGCFDAMPAAYRLEDSVRVEGQRKGWRMAVGGSWIDTVNDFRIHDTSADKARSAHGMFLATRDKKSGKARRFGC